MPMPTDRTEKIAVFPHQNRAPEPEPGKQLWRRALEGFLGENPEKAWGERLVRVASDMIVVCDQDLQILFHSRSLVTGLGYEEGSYIGHSLMEFIPSKDKADASRTFDQFLAGNSAGMRIEASFLTRRRPCRVEARVTRTRRSAERHFLYFVIRDLSVAENETGAVPEKAEESILAGLPLAGFRTDHQLRITHAFGSFWETMGLNSDSLIGADLSNANCPVAPLFFYEIDYCDVMAGQTFHTSLTWNDHDLEITIDPFIDRTKAGRVISTLGVIREAKNATPAGNSHLSFPKPEEFTRLQKMARSVSLEPVPSRKPERAVQPHPGISPELARLRSAIQPRPLRPASEEAGSEEVALTN